MSTPPHARNISRPMPMQPRKSFGATGSGSNASDRSAFRSTVEALPPKPAAEKMAQSSLQSAVNSRMDKPLPSVPAGSSTRASAASMFSESIYSESAVFDDDAVSDAEPEKAALISSDPTSSRGWDTDIDLFSIFAGYRNVHASLGGENYDGVSKLVTAYIRPLSQALDKIGDAPPTIRTTSVYDSAYKAVLFARELLESHTSKLRPALKGADVTDFFLTTYQLLEMTMTNFRNLLQVIETERSTFQSYSEEVLESEECHLDGDTCVIIVGPPLPDTPRKPRKLSFLQRLRVTSLVCSSGVDLESPAVRTSGNSLAMGIDGFTSRRSSFAETVSRRGSCTKSHLSRPSLDRRSVKTDDSIMASMDGPTIGDGASMLVRNGSVTTLSDDTSADVCFNDLDGGKCNIRASLALFPPAGHSLTLIDIPAWESETQVVRGKDGKISAATLPALVQLFTDHREVLTNDMTDLYDAFFLFFRFFTPPSVFFDMLVARYAEKPPLDMTTQQSDAWRLYHRMAKMHVAKLLSMWLEFHWKQDTDGELIDRIVQFTYGTLAKDTDVPPETSKLVACHLLDRSSGRMSRYGHWLEREVKRTEDAIELPVPTAFKARLKYLEALRSHEVNVVDIKYFCKPGGAEELARQLTILEAEFFHAFLPEELIHFSEPEFQKKLEAWKKFSNALSLWVPTSILEHFEVATRAEIVELFILVAIACKDMRNYSSALAILLGLQSNSIVRLRKTQEAVKMSCKEHRAQLEEFFHARSNWRAYRAEMPRNIPAVPLEMVLIKDIKQCREALPRASSIARPPSRATEELIHLQYCRNLRRTVRDLEKCYGSYKLERLEFLQAWLKHHVNKLAGKNYEEYAQILTEKSLQAEPRTVQAKLSCLNVGSEAASGPAG